MKTWDHLEVSWKSSIQQGVLMKMGSVDLIVFQEAAETSHIARWAGMSR
jgi:hypothetical protein